MNDIRLTTKQTEGLKIAIKRYKSREPYTCIAGFAGTGKSTLVQYIIKELHIPDYLIAYVAYTGKASLVLQQKGCPGATTAHRLLYYSKELSCTITARPLIPDGAKWFGVTNNT